MNADQLRQFFKLDTRIEDKLSKIHKQWFLIIDNFIDLDVLKYLLSWMDDKNFDWVY
jgi:hypothetical protein